MILAGNILNIIAPIVQILSFLCKSKTKVLFGVLLASSIWVVAYILLGTTSAAILTCLGIIVPVVNYFTEKHFDKHFWWLYPIYAAFVVTVTIVFYEDPIGLLPSFAVLFLVASTLPKKQVLFRVLLLCMSGTWLAYGITLSQFGIIVGNAIQMTSLACEIVYYGIIEPKRKNKTDGTVESKESDNE